MNFEDTVHQITEVNRKRMTRKDKKKFIDFVSIYAEENGIPLQVDRERFGTNLIFNQLSHAKHIIIAHYDTPPQMPKFMIKHQIIGSFFTFFLVFFAIGLIPIKYNFILAIGVLIVMELYLMGLFKGSNPHNYNDNSSGVIAIFRMMEKLRGREDSQDYAYVLMDNEEKGLLGSMIFSKKYKNCWRHKNIVNLDCVGLGDHINLYAFNQDYGKKVGELLKDNSAHYPVEVHRTSFFKMSDHHSFKTDSTLMIATEFKKRKKYYMKNIHSRSDREINLNNIEVIVEGLLKL